MKTIKGPQAGKHCPSIKGVFVQKLADNFYGVSFPNPDNVRGIPFSTRQTPYFPTYLQAERYAFSVANGLPIYLNESRPEHFYPEKSLFKKPLTTGIPFVWRREYQRIG